MNRRVPSAKLAGMPRGRAKRTSAQWWEVGRDFTPMSSPVSLRRSDHATPNRYKNRRI